MALSRSTDYDASAQTADAPLSIEDVEDLLDGHMKPFARNARAVEHFVRRVAITIRAYRQQIRVLQYEIAQERTNSSRAGAATTLSPLDSLRYLSPEQQRQVFAEHFKEKLDALDRMTTDAQQTRVALQNEQNRVRFAVAELLEDPTIDPGVRDRLGDLLTAAVGATDPAVAPVPRPAAVPPPAPIAGAPDVAATFVPPAAMGPT